MKVMFAAEAGIPDALLNFRSAAIAGGINRPLYRNDFQVLSVFGRLWMSSEQSASSAAIAN